MRNDFRAKSVVEGNGLHVWDDTFATNRASSSVELWEYANNSMV